MDLDFIARLLDLVECSDVAELELTLDGARLRVVKAGAAASLPAAALALAPPRSAVTPQESPFAAPPPAYQPAGRKLHAVRAGFPGTFYRAPAPGSPPFVSVGDPVEDGKQLAIVEAMKTMNPVEADAAGTIVGIAAEDAQPVEAGDLLFEIAPHG